MWLLFISICAGVMPASCPFVSSGQTFISFSRCVNVGHAALNEQESAARINAYRCVKVTP